MTKRFHLKIDVTKEERCHRCPIAEWNFIEKQTETETVFGPGKVKCRIAALEEKLKRIPIFTEIEETYQIYGNVYWFRIPENCPNKYFNPDDQPASRRRK
jgi:hypothetical protein